MLEDGIIAVVVLDAPRKGGGVGFHIFPGALVFVLGVDDHAVHVRREGVTDDAEDQVQLVVQQDRRGGLFPLPLDALPQPAQELDVRLDLVLALSLACGPDNVAHVRLPEGLHDLAEPLPLLAVLDAAGNADVVHAGHHNEIPARDADVGGDPRTLGADGLLRDLDDDVLAFLQKVLDLRGVGAFPLGLHFQLQAFILHHGRILRGAVEHVADVEERRFFQTDVHEGGLHPGKDLHDAALIDVPRNAAVLPPVDEDVGHEAVLQQGDPGLLPACVHDDL